MPAPKRRSTPSLELGEERLCRARVHTVHPIAILPLARSAPLHGTSPVSGCAATAGDCGRDARTLASIRAWHASYSTSIVAHASVACRAHRRPAWREVVRYGSARCVRALHFASMVCFWSWISSSSSLIGREQKMKRILQGAHVAETREPPPLARGVFLAPAQLIGGR